MNCYFREVASVSQTFQFSVNAEGNYVLQIELPLTKVSLSAMTEKPSLTGTFLYKGKCQYRTDGSFWHECSLDNLLTLLTREIAADKGCEPHPELFTLIKDSLAVSEELLTFPRIAPDNYLKSEQSLIFGHPFHPSPKSRQGFSGEDLRKYSPEASGHFPLYYFAVREDLIVQESLEPSSTTELINTSELSAVFHEDGFAFVPVHPWQAQCIKTYPLFQTALRSGQIRDIGTLGRDFYATSSVRTLYRPGADYFFKMSLNVRITNCIRRNALHELQSSLMMTKMMREAKWVLSRLFPDFVALEEPAYLSVDLTSIGTKADLHDCEKLTESFGMMLRQNIDSAIPKDVVPILSAAFFGNRSLGREALLSHTKKHGAENWFKAYIDQLLHPLLYLFFSRGLMFEPHLQNILIGLKDGFPDKLILRDFDNGKIITDWFDTEKFADAPPLVKNELKVDSDYAWDRFVYCLFVNNIAEAAYYTANGDSTLELRLWHIVRNSLLSFQMKFGNERSRLKVARLIESKSLPTKGNLLTRFLKQPDRKASFFPVFNPLSAISSTGFRAEESCL